MKTPFGLLTYCSNIHPGEDWKHHFSVLQSSIPEIKNSVSKDAPMGIGLRLANQASIDLSETANFEAFQNWLTENDCYVFTMNGFPYGGFHDVVVKDQVHAPDWTTDDRVQYTIRMFKLLSKLLPAEMQEGGISTSPLSYRFWWKIESENPLETLHHATTLATQNMLLVVDELIAMKETTGKVLHLDIEPEPDGILENSTEFITWYEDYLRPIAIEYFAKKGISVEETLAILHTHIQLCYDVCHFAVSYEKPEIVVEKLAKANIAVGKIQISSAIKVDFTNDAETKLKAIAQYDEASYLHQVIARKADGTFEKYQDLGLAIQAYEEGKHEEWRVHFHVPLFIEQYGELSSTQSDIVDTIGIHKQKPFTNHLEIETYTWGVLPPEVQVPLNESIAREVTWVKGLL
ncbi:metabolite traffic protein EboE [Arcicella sp. DC2W]|uniref:Metabolite traffic protein EboE n=1 Tax=Arcicella gelida TaxID=2984195 RepID=A0ABU5S5K5_9BACT|nr:metabolite traffic protein EboE [Arcicella sp. DC2W]MEA5403768.1 metabolite traffic protein EboE [Arcicella sp. DC2W]